jgi:pyruvate/2-oxoglutarate dehydrogenase complex dihydrolipoamide acyltransferase (E2) component
MMGEGSGGIGRATDTDTPRATAPSAATPATPAAAAAAAGTPAPVLADAPPRLATLETGTTRADRRVKNCETRREWACALVASRRDIASERFFSASA